MRRDHHRTRLLLAAVIAGVLAVAGLALSPAVGAGGGAAELVSGDRAAAFLDSQHAGADEEGILGVTDSTAASPSTTTATPTTTAVRARPTTTTLPPLPEPPAPPTTVRTTTTWPPGIPPPPEPLETLRAGVPDVTQPYAPGAWRISQNGISIDVRMTPADPQEGQTVTFTFSASITTGDFCCYLGLVMGADTTPLFRTDPTGPSACPQPKSASGSATWTIPRRGNIGFKVYATSARSLCTLPMQFAEAILYGGFVVQPW